ncbi:MAG: hypothetical protein Q8908_09365 [Bacteroidota bacterium]|nr:hypothetical protein [Bacteroidota bacterium]
MKRVNLLMMGVILSVAAMTGCKKDAASSKSTPVLGVSIEALNSSFNLPVTPAVLKSVSTAPLVNISSAKLLVSKLSFEAELKSSNKSKDSISIEYNWNGPKLIDLLNPGTEFGLITLQPGFYDEIELRVSSVREISDTVPLFTLQGNYTNSTNVVVPITFTLSEPILLKTELKNDTITSSAGSVFSGAVQIYLDQLFVNVLPADLDNAVKTNGTIVINNMTNKNLYQIISENLLKRHRCEYHRHGR